MSKVQKIMSVCVAGAVACVAGWSAVAETSEELETQLARDLTVAQKPIFQIGEQQQGAGRIEVEAWVDNPSLTYAVGQPLRVMVRPRQDAYITVVDVGTSGRVAVLYPNHFQRDARVRAESTVMIPGQRAGWEIKVGGPVGVNLIQVIASPQPLSLPELTKLVSTNETSPLVTLGRSAEEVARDLVPQLKPAATASEPSIGVRNVLVRVMPAPTPASAAMTGAAVQASVPNSSFGLVVRADRAVYRIGEPVRIAASVQSDCRLTLINVGAGGNAVQLFPNAYQRGNLLRPGQVLTVPAPGSPLKLVAGGPVGVEGIIGVCRKETTPAPAVEAGQGGFVTVGKVEAVGRDLLASATGTAVAANEVEQSSTSYIVVE